MKSFARYSGFGFQMIAIIGLGVYAGIKLDEKYPNKYKAHTMVNNAIRDKRLFKEPCEVCNCTEKIHAHHDDYAKPLNIRWLCAEHHRQWHIENGEAKNP